MKQLFVLFVMLLFASSAALADGLVGTDAKYNVPTSSSVLGATQVDTAYCVAPGKPSAGTDGLLFASSSGYRKSITAYPAPYKSYDFLKIYLSTSGSVQPTASRWTATTESPIEYITYHTSKPIGFDIRMINATYDHLQYPDYPPTMVDNTTIKSQQLGCYQLNSSYVWLVYHTAPANVGGSDGLLKFRASYDFGNGKVYGTTKQFIVLDDISPVKWSAILNDYASYLAIN